MVGSWRAHGYVRRVLYFDNNATTRMAPEVRQAMEPFLDGEFANPSSPYSFAWGAALAVARAREQVARMAGASPEEIFFTSGGTEANNAALNHLVATDAHGAIALSAVEHASVRNFARRRAGERELVLETVAVDRDGAPDASQLDNASGPLALMWANNETGVIFPVQEHAKGRRVHSDAVQAAGKVALNLEESGVETAAFSAHKFHGPKGIGALYIRKGTKFVSYLVGGDQEGGVRAGTENVAGIVGMGRAAELALDHLSFVREEIRAMRDEFEARMTDAITGLAVAGLYSPRLPNTSMLLIPGCETEALIALLDMEGICVSSGSACASGSHEPSHVLQAMGLPVGKDMATIRVSMSRYTAREEMDVLADAMIKAVQRIRG